MKVDALIRAQELVDDFIQIASRCTTYACEHNLNNLTSVLVDKTAKLQELKDILKDFEKIDEAVIDKLATMEELAISLLDG